MSEWLSEEGLEGLVEKFKANNIDGTELLSLTKETLASELGIGEEDKCHTLLSEQHHHLFTSSLSCCPYVYLFV